MGSIPSGGVFGHIVVDTAAGKTRFKFSTSGAIIYGPASISNGVLYQGDLDGDLYAFRT